MLKSEIVVGGHYIAKVGANITTVRVDAIREHEGFKYGNGGRTVRGGTRYEVTNLKTGRSTTFNSASKFRGEAKEKRQEVEGIRVGCRVEFIGPVYPQFNMVVGTRGTVEDIGGEVKPVGGEMQTLVTVSFDGRARKVVIGHKRLRRVDDNGASILCGKPLLGGLLCKLPKGHDGRCEGAKAIPVPAPAGAAAMRTGAPLTSPGEDVLNPHVDCNPQNVARIGADVLVTQMQHQMSEQVINADGEIAHRIHDEVVMTLPEPMKEGEQRPDPTAPAAAAQSSPSATTGTPAVTSPEPTLAVKNCFPPLPAREFTYSDFKSLSVEKPLMACQSLEPTFAEKYGGPAGPRESAPATASYAAVEQKFRGVGLAGKIAASVDNAPHLIISARAGTGKTTTLIEGLKRVKGLGSKLTPSPQQAAVWEAMELSRGKASSICFVAFNKSIAMELESRVPEGCEAMTMHSMGFKAVQKTFGRLDVSKWRVTDIICSILGKDPKDVRRDNFVLLKATEELVALCKVNLLDDYGADVLDELTSHFDVELEGNRPQVYDLVPEVMRRCLDVSSDRRIDFNDMVWLPAALKLPITKYDVLLVDEFQDTNRCQQALAKMAGTRLILVGDDRQAIYGFAGADSAGMQRMRRELEGHARGCVVLPLTETRRCGKAIVAEARKIAPDFSAHESNPEGCVARAMMTTSSKKELRPEDDYRLRVKDGDMVLCRLNAPLVSQCFRFLKEGRRANIQGRDVGQGLTSLVTKMKADNVPDLIAKLDKWLSAEVAKEQAKRNPSAAKVTALQDRFDCILCFAEGQTTVKGVLDKIDSVFTDARDGAFIRLSSIHKSKGLEADNVFILQPKMKMRQPEGWQLEQEHNLRYVAITRAKHVLTFVGEVAE